MGWEELRVEADLSGPTVVEGGILIYMSHMDSEATRPSRSSFSQPSTYISHMECEAITAFTVFSQPGPETT